MLVTSHSQQIPRDLPAGVRAFSYVPFGKVLRRCSALVYHGGAPDYFSATGQLWGNPLYDWDYLARTRYGWWIDRLRAAFELYDIIRLDHFRGFETYWEVPAGAADARGGQWRKGPGLPFLRVVREALPDARIIAEDLGYIGPGVGVRS